MIEKNPENIIFEAVYVKDIEKLQQLITNLTTQFERTKKLNLKDSYLRTPIFYALYHNNFEIVNILL